jgi:hypothetical protein
MKQTTLFDDNPPIQKLRLRTGEFCTPKQKELDDRLRNMRKVENENSRLKREVEKWRRKAEALQELISLETRKNANSKD